MNWDYNTKELSLDI
jgi:hypothetical protein